MADVNVHKMRKLGFRMAMVASHLIPLLGFFENAPQTLQQAVVSISFASITCFLFSYMISNFLRTLLRFHPPSFRVIILFFVGVFCGVCLLFNVFYFLIFMAAATSFVKCFAIIIPLVNVFCVLRYDNYLYVPFFD